jgi:uracil-DNA glycosylase family 4
MSRLPAMRPAAAPRASAPRRSAQVPVLTLSRPAVNAANGAPLAALQAEMRACRLCVKAGYLVRADSVAGFRGRVSDRIVLIGQAPGRVSVERGMPFSGPGGRVLEDWLQRAGFAAGDLRRRVYLTSLTKCDPGSNPHGGDRKPSPAELALCRPYLQRELDLIRPAIILLVGSMAIEALLGKRRLDDVIGAGFERDGVRLLPLPHPSGVSRWLNAPAHQALLRVALDQLSVWRMELAAEPDAARTPP